MRRELAQQRNVRLVERVALMAQDVERANHLRLIDQRHDQRRVHPRHVVLVARIALHVVEHHRPLLGDRGADDAFTDLEADGFGDPGGIAGRVGDAQLAALLVEQIDGERVVGNDAARAAR